MLETEEYGIADDGSGLSTTRFSRIKKKAIVKFVFIDQRKGNFKTHPDKYNTKLVFCWSLDQRKKAVFTE